jgi:hypothetical protein
MEPTALGEASVNYSFHPEFSQLNPVLRVFGQKSGTYYPFPNPAISYQTKWEPNGRRKQLAELA